MKQKEVKVKQSKDLLLDAQRRQAALGRMLIELVQLGHRHNNPHLFEHDLLKAIERFEMKGT